MNGKNNPGKPVQKPQPAAPAKGQTGNKQGQNIKSPIAPTQPKGGKSPVTPVKTTKK